LSDAVRIGGDSMSVPGVVLLSTVAPEPPPPHADKVAAATAASPNAIDDRMVVSWCS
jgi:hypothetical protein